MTTEEALEDSIDEAVDEAVAEEVSHNLIGLKLLKKVQV